MQNVTVIGSLIQAQHIEPGDFLLGLDNGYVVENEEGDGYLSYPRSSMSTGVAMPDDTRIIIYHDAEGEENFVLANPSTLILVKRP